MLITGIREVLCSNLNRDSGHLEGFRGFTQFLHGNVLTVRQIRIRPDSKFLPVHGQQPSQDVPLLYDLTADRGLNKS